MSGVGKQEPEDKPIDKIGGAAKRTTALIVIGVIFAVAVVVLGGLFFYGFITSEPFLLLVGLAVGFALGWFVKWL